MGYVSPFTPNIKRSPVFQGQDGQNGELAWPAPAQSLCKFPPLFLSQIPRLPKRVLAEAERVQRTAVHRAQPDLVDRAGAAINASEPDRLQRRQIASPDSLRPAAVQVSNLVVLADTHTFCRFS